MSDTKIAFTKAEAAVACGVSPKTIERAVKSHALLGAGEQVGPATVLSGALEAWIEGLADA